MLNNSLREEEARKPRANSNSLAVHAPALSFMAMNARARLSWSQRPRRGTLCSLWPVGRRGKKEEAEPRPFIKPHGRGETSEANYFRTAPASFLVGSMEEPRINGTENSKIQNCGKQRKVGLGNKRCGSSLPDIGLKSEEACCHTRASPPHLSHTMWLVKPGLIGKGWNQTLGIFGVLSNPSTCLRNKERQGPAPEATLEYSVC
ncbi:hypothetical protein QBC44DRAFT_391197 [Cladorrhinum sp. PSN332]|nr:hypothetical protein QBC44DRAFT_391197 [Cladorrhinum sp. PSN332]